MYRSSRFFFFTCLFHCICAPLYKVNGQQLIMQKISKLNWGGVYEVWTFMNFFLLQVTLPDFFLADQFTSQVGKIMIAMYQMLKYPSLVYQQVHNIDHSSLYIVNFCCRCKPLEVLSSTFATMFGETSSTEKAIATSTKATMYTALSMSLLL